MKEGICVCMEWYTRFSLYNIYKLKRISAVIMDGTFIQIGSEIF